MKSRIVRKSIVFGIIILLLLVGIYPSLAINTIKESNILSNGGNTLYVGGSGPGNYIFIQDSIENEVTQNLNNKPGEFLSLYYGELYMQIEKEGLNHLGVGRGSFTHAFYLHFNATIDELKIELVLNYTAEMNYSFKFPFYFAPILIFGIKIQNITNYEWEYFKLKHHSYFSQHGNFSIVFDIDMTDIENGDELIIQPIISMQTVPSFFRDSYNKSLLRLIRLIYHIPFLNDLLLCNWLFPKIATYEKYNWNTAPLFLFFD